MFDEAKVVTSKFLQLKEKLDELANKVKGIDVSEVKNSIEQKNKPEIDLASGTDEFISVPVIGKVAAGVPILAVENIEERICVPTPMFKGNDLYSLNVSGDSMINCGILDGDKIIVRRQNTAKNGEIAGFFYIYDVISLIHPVKNPPKNGQKN